MKLFSPIQGTIIKKYKNKGELAITGQQVFTISDLNVLDVSFSLSDSERKHLIPEMDFSVYIESSKDSFPGKIKKINPFINEKTNTVQIISQIRNKNKELIPGEYVKISIPIGKGEKFISVPHAAIAKDINKNHFLWVWKEGKIKKRQVELGLIEEEWVEVKSGVKEGEIVVLKNSEKLTEEEYWEIDFP